MAPTGDATLPRIKSTLPDRHTRVLSQTVLEKVERAARTHHSTQFREGKSSIGNRAQRERREGGITAGVTEGDGLAVEADMLDGDRRGGNSAGGQSPSDLGRFDREDNIDRGRVVRHIESGAEADLDHPAPQAAGDPGAPFRHTGSATSSVHEPGQDVLTVKAHVRNVAGTDVFVCDRVESWRGTFGPARRYADGVD